MHRWQGWALVLLGTVSCTGESGEAAPRLPSRIVDLSPTLHPRAPSEQWGQPLQRAYSLPDSLPFVERVGDPVYALFTTITLADHVGAHVDAPLHLIPGGQAVDELALERFIGPVRLLDFRSATPDEPIGPDQLAVYEIEAGDVVLVLTGYTPRTGPDDLPSYPYLSGEAAEYLASLEILAFGSHMPSTGSFRFDGDLLEEEPTSDHVIPEHRAFLKRGIPNIENLTNLEALIGVDEAVFVGFPLKVRGVSGGLMRATALVY